MRTECEGSLNTPTYSEIECHAAHNLHKTHVSWSHTATSSDPTGCHQCHAFARNVLRSAAAFSADRQASDARRQP